LQDSGYKPAFPIRGMGLYQEGRLIYNNLLSLGYMIAAQHHD